MEKQEKLRECAAYFKKYGIYEKLFQKYRDKYAALGRFGGTVVLGNLSPEDKEHLGGFFRKDYTENKSVSISAAMMEKALAESRFEGLDWKDILEAYFEEPLLVKKELEIEEEKERQKYFADVLKNLKSQEGKLWLESVLRERTKGYLLLLQQYKHDKEKLKEILYELGKVISILPAFTGGKKLLLPVLSAKATGNPHYFDEETAAGRLLFAFLKSNFHVENGTVLSEAEYKRHLFFEAGIIKDEVSNDVLVFGVCAVKQDGSAHLGIDGFCQCREPLRLTLQSLGNLKEVRAENGKESIVYIVENPAVFSILAERYPDRSIVCGNGQLNLAVLILMDKFPEDTIFYYAGDFDPEGLLIAQRLKLRYGSRLTLWRYEVSLYEKYVSDVSLQDNRLKKLDKIVIEELQEMKSAVLKQKKAAYQEAMLEEFK